MTVTADVMAELNRKLHDDAGIPDDPPASVPGPPRLPDREAPHGRADDGSPVAPYGLKADGTPRLKPAGPGRGNRAEDKPRTEVTTVTPPDPKSAPDFTEDLNNLGLMVWLGASSLRGGKLWKARIPDARPYAAVWKQQLPGLVLSWNVAAQQNATVRGYVRKLSGDGSWSWVLGVAMTGISLVAACSELAKAPPHVREQAGQVNDAEVQVFMMAQMEAMGLIQQEAA